MKRTLNGRAGLFALLLAPVLLAGCGGGRTQMANMWRDPTFASPMKNVYVVAIRLDPVRRRLWEDAFVTELGKVGVNATPSYRAFPTEPPDTGDVITQVRDHGYDGVFINVRLESQAQDHWVPGYTTREPVTVQNPWTGWYSTYYQNVHHPGYAETDVIRRFQTDAWSTRPPAHMVWSGTTETLESGSHPMVGMSVAKHIVPEMEESGIIPKAPSKTP